MNYKKIILIGIIMLGAVLRLYKLDSYPALNADEAALGYNAYSLLETGKDEHGNPWPIHFQSFNDYKPGFYVYLLLPFVKFMGMNEWAVRLPAALLGIASIFVIYLLAKQMFKSERHALSTAFLLTINPWHLHFSRGAWEVNVATFFIILGVYAFVKGVKSSMYLTISVLSFSIALYSYHAARVIIPFLGLGLLWFYLPEVKKNLKAVVISALIGGFLLIPLAIDFLGPAGTSRASGVSIFADPGPLSRIEEQRGEHGDLDGIAARLLHNKLVNYSLLFANNWAEHYHGEFLFLSGDEIQRNKVPETGQFYFFEIITIGIGLLIAIKNLKNWKLVLFWALIAPFAASLTFQSPHALRAHNLVIPLTVLSGCGLATILSIAFRFRKVVLVLAMLIISWSLVRYLHMYYDHLAKEYPFSSQYGLKELSQFLNNSDNSYERVVVTDRYDQPYIMLLFYMKYPPEKFQKDHSLSSKDKFGFSTVRYFDKYYFEEIDFLETRINYPNSLIVGTPEQIPEEANIIKEVYGANGYKYFEVVLN